jgi:hypothetical protein
VKLNNAVLLAHHRYLHRIEKFEILYKNLGRDLKKMVEFFKKIQGSKEEPFPFLERWMKERGITVSHYENK